MILEDPDGSLLARFAGGRVACAVPKEDTAAEESGESKERTEFPAAVWSAFGGEGIPFRMRVSDLGPVLLSGMLQLTEPQAELLEEAFAAADREGLLLDDAADLSAYLAWYAGDRKQNGAGKPNAGVAARIGKRLEAFCRACGGDPFGTPSVSPWDFLLSGRDGRGVLHFVEGRESGPCLLFLLAAMAQRFPGREGEKAPVLAAVLQEKTAKTSAETMQEPLKKRGILLLAQSAGAGEAGASLSAAFPERITGDISACPAPQEGGMAGILERTRRLPLADRLRNREEIRSAREVLAAQRERSGKTQEAEDGEKEEKDEKDEKETRRRGNAAWHDVGRSVAGTVGRQIGEDVGKNFGDFGRRLGGNLGASLGRGILSTLLRH